MTAYELAYQLADSIRGSAEFRNFNELKKKIQSDQAKQKIMSDFHLKQWEIQQDMLLGLEVSAEKQRSLEQFYSLLSLYSDSREYLNAEFEFYRLVNDIQKILGDAIHEAMPVGFEKSVDLELQSLFE